MGCAAISSNITNCCSPAKTAWWRRVPIARERRYSINLLVDRSRETHPPVICEHNPTYENLFGFIEYRQLPGGGLDTDVTLIRPGALHRANGGVLILRAEALVRDLTLWAFLKGALRDGEIRIEEFYRANSPPLAGAPKPVPVQLDFKVIVVGAPQWYYVFFAQDPEFQVYFKVKAEIEPTADATHDNLCRYAGLIAVNARRNGIEVDARRHRAAARHGVEMGGTPRSADGALRIDHRRDDRGVEALSRRAADCGTHSRRGERCGASETARSRIAFSARSAKARS